MNIEAVDRITDELREAERRLAAAKMRSTDADELFGLAAKVDDLKQQKQRALWTIVRGSPEPSAGEIEIAKTIEEKGLRLPVFSRGRVICHCVSSPKMKAMAAGLAKPPMFAPAAKHPIGKRWKQKDVDREIEKLRDQVAANHGGFDTFARKCKQSKHIQDQARKLFGRRSLIKRLGLKSPEHLARSPAYSEIRKALTCLGRPGRHKKIGFDIAAERASYASYRNKSRQDRENDAKADEWAAQKGITLPPAD